MRSRAAEPNRAQAHFAVREDGLGSAWSSLWAGIVMRRTFGQRRDRIDSTNRLITIFPVTSEHQLRTTNPGTVGYRETQTHPRSL